MPPMMAGVAICVITLGHEKQWAISVWTIRELKEHGEKNLEHTRQSLTKNPIRACEWWLERIKTRASFIHMALGLIRSHQWHRGELGVKETYPVDISCALCRLVWSLQSNKTCSAQKLAVVSNDRLSWCDVYDNIWRPALWRKETFSTDLNMLFNCASRDADYRRFIVLQNMIYIGKQTEGAWIQHIDTCLKVKSWQFQHVSCLMLHQPLRQLLAGIVRSFSFYQYFWHLKLIIIIILMQTLYYITIL